MKVEPAPGRMCAGDAGSSVLQQRERVMTSEAVPILEMQGISKRFPGVMALSSVDFRLVAGEVHALMDRTARGSRRSSRC